MAIPQKCEVLVVGGGPAGSYAAAVLAREGMDVVVLESEKFPRYHVGESMLSSMRHFLRFIDLDDAFNNFGFRVKKGACFKFNEEKGVAYTDFVAAAGPNGYAWNVTRADADNLIFRHAEASGAHVFDGVRVNGVEFDSGSTFDPANPSRAVAATWSRKEDGSSGKINFSYMVDASGRYGLMSAKYLKNRRYNQGLKNIAHWGYWRGAGSHGKSKCEQESPYFEHLQDASGWVWFIPLHDGTTSVGVVMRQDVAAAKKKAMAEPSTKGFYEQTINREVPGIKNILSEAEMVDESVHVASDWSYSASVYASPNVRIAGDAGCFVDPFFSSGVHLALTAGLSAATTIAASKRGDCSEKESGEWHTAKVQGVYTHFLMVVLASLKQITRGNDNVLTDFDETGFERAFSHFRPIIQGTTEVSSKLTVEEVSKTLDFCMQALRPTEPAKKEAVIEKVEDISRTQPNKSSAQAARDLEAVLTPDEMQVLTTVRARDMLKRRDTVNIDSFGEDSINGLRANIEKGNLGLSRSGPEPSAINHVAQPDYMSLMMREKERFEPPIPVPVVAT